MLVLARKVGQSIVIVTEGEDVEVMVVEVRDGQVRLGVNAPKRMPVHRKELLEQIREQNRIAEAEAKGKANRLSGLVNAGKAVVER